MRQRLRYLLASTICGVAALIVVAAARSAPVPNAHGRVTMDAANPARHNVILFITDGLRHDAVTHDDSPTIDDLRHKGVDFVNSHSLFPTVTTANASALATGHGLGDTGDFTNELYVPPNPAICKANHQPLTFDVENDQDLAQMNCLNNGNYVGVEETLISLARKNKYNTAVVGKRGPAAIQDIPDVGFGKDDPRSLKEPETVIIDDNTGKDNGFPIPARIGDRMKKELGGQTAAPGRSSNGDPGDVLKRGTLAANVEQQKYFTDVVVKAILPEFQQDKKPFLLVFWSRDPDGTQHYQGDSFDVHEQRENVNKHTLKPGINGDTSKKAIHNADDNLSQILDYLKKNKLEESTDVIVTADHGFSTISKGPLDPSGTSKAKSYAAGAGVVSDREKVVEGDLPPGFLALDLAHYLHKGNELYDLKLDSNGLKRIGSSGYLPESALIKADDSGKTDGNIITVPSGNSELIYILQAGSDNARQKAVAAQICEFLVQQNYVDGVFVRDDLGEFPGALPLSAVGLFGGSAKLPTPAILANFKGFPLEAERPWYTWVTIADTTLQQGQGMHGGLNRADTFNNIVAFGPDFATKFKDTAPVSNADVAQTIAHILGLSLPSGKWQGRVLREALRGESGNPYKFDHTPEVKSSKASPNGVRTVLHFQKLNEWVGSKSAAQPSASYLYFDQACFVSAVASGDARCPFSSPTVSSNAAVPETDKHAAR